MHRQSDMLEDISNTPTPDKAHPWRICPIGQHYVKEHLLHTPKSKEHPEGEIVTRHAHCTDNSSGHDSLSYDELQLITEKYFSTLTNPPKSGALRLFPKADNFDQYIGGWVQYWNDIFIPADPLDPNLIKALIASESSFKPEEDTPQNTPGKNKTIGHGRGLMQITDSTWRIIENKNPDPERKMEKFHALYEKLKG